MEDRQRRFEELVSGYKDKIYRLCCAYLRNEQDREDLYQNILLKIYRGLDGFHDRSSVGTWVFRISVNSSIDFLRSEKRRTTGGIETDPAELGLAEGSMNAEQIVLASEKTRLLKERLNWLSFLDKTLISLYLEDLSYREIAEVVGMSAQNVGVRLHRIKNRLNKELGESKR